MSKRLPLPHSSLGFALLAVVLLVVYVAMVGRANTKPRLYKIHEMQVAPPAELQIISALGDRYLAANIGAFRSQTVGVHELQANTYQVLASVQLNTALLNPKHEDNYYTAAAILPWNGQLDAAQEVLGLATTARTRDYLPPFFRGFNWYYFKKDYAAASASLLVAADRAEDVNRNALTAMAVRWAERGYELEQALQMVEAMSKDSAPPLKFFLEQRAARLRNMISLKRAAESYQNKHGVFPDRLAVLVEEKFVSAIPQDPMGASYTIRKGNIEVLNVPR